MPPARSMSMRSMNSYSSGGSAAGRSKYGSDFMDQAGPDETIPSLQLLDANGIDVTPRNLVSPEVLKKMNLKNNLSASQAHVGLSSFGTKSVNMGSTMLLGRKFTQKSGGTSTQVDSSKSMTITMPFSKSFAMTSISSDGGGSRAPSVHVAVAECDGLVSGISDVTTLHTTEVEQEEVSEEDLDKQVDIMLTESDTFFLYDAPGSFVPSGGSAEEEEAAAAVMADNARYDALLQKNMRKLTQFNRVKLNVLTRPWGLVVSVKVAEGGVQLTDRAAQTLHFADKTKICQVSAVETSSVGCSASESNIHDTYVALDTVGNTASTGSNTHLDDVTNSNVGDVPNTHIDGVTETTLRAPISTLSQHDMYTDPLAHTVAERGALWSGNLDMARDVGVSDAAKDTSFANVSQHPDFGTHLRLLERLIVHADPASAHRQRLYRGCALDETAARHNIVSPPVAVADGATAASETAGEAANETAARPASQPVSRPSTGLVTGDPDTGNSDNGVDEAPSPIVQEPDATQRTTTVCASNSDTAAPSGLADVDAVVPLEDVGAVGTATQKGPHIQPLWTHACDLTLDKVVTCMAWNKTNGDILVAGYGHLDHRSVGERGVVCCWSFKNTRYPERHYMLDSGVCSVDFSQNFPGLLAVGCYDGTVAIFDVKSTLNDPVVTSRDLEPSMKHSEAVWQVKFVTQADVSAATSVEILVSAAMDGTVRKWALSHKGLQSSQLIRLKQTTATRTAVSKETHTPFITAYDACMALDFHGGDTQLYVVGTESGAVHQCSCTYNEQTLRDYVGHTGTINAIRCSPNAYEVFLTCSADWTVQVWTEESEAALKTLRCGTRAGVVDCAWAPNFPTVFGAVSDSHVYLWDLATDGLDPIVTHQHTPPVPKEEEVEDVRVPTPPPVAKPITSLRELRLAQQQQEQAVEAKKEKPPPHYTCITFAPTGAVVAWGDDSGSVHVGMLTGVGVGVGAPGLVSTPESRAHALRSALLTES